MRAFRQLRVFRSFRALWLPVLATATSLGGQATTGTWAKVADMPTPRAAHAAVATSDAIYVLGGTGGKGTPVLAVDRFDGTRWTTEGNIPGEGLNAPAAAILGDALYLIGGFGTTTNRPTAAVHRYDLRKKTWSEAPLMAAPRGGHAATVLDGRIHVIGGGNSLSTIDDHSVYDPKTNVWTERARLPRRMGSPAAVIRDGKLYSVGGRSGPGDFGDVHIYDPKADAWTPGPSIDARGTGGAAVLDGTLYYFGGEAQARSVVLGDVLKLTRGASSWTSDASMPTPRNFSRAVLFRGAIYIVGGSTQYGSSHASTGSTVVERFAVK
jgi:N-acetylneuraminic acid mutarotase